MQIKDVSAQPTADLLKVFVTGGIQDTALAGAIRVELEDRGVDVGDAYRAVLDLIAMVAARADGLDEPEGNDDESLYCAGLEPGSWCEEGNDDE